MTTTTEESFRCINVPGKRFVVTKPVFKNSYLFTIKAFQKDGSVKTWNHVLNTNAVLTWNLIHDEFANAFVDYPYKGSVQPLNPNEYEYKQL